MANLNKVMIIGNLGKASELKYAQTGMPYATFPVATNKYYKDDAGVRHEKTTWFNCVVFGKTAEDVNKYLTSGKLVYVEGELSNDKYTDKDGVERYSTKIIARIIQILEKINKEDEGVSESNETAVPGEAAVQGEPPMNENSQNQEENIPF